jgi:hypothetical protein
MAADCTLVCSCPMDRTRLYALFVLFLIPSTLRAATFPCKPCAGVRLEPIPASSEAAPADPALAAASTAPTTAAGVAALLPQVARLEPGSPLYVAWEVPLDGTAPSAEEMTALRQAGATAWLSLVFRTPAPLAQNSARLQTELRAAAEVAGRAPQGTWFQVIWRPETPQTPEQTPETTEPAATEYAFLLKRAAVTLTGARADVLVATQPLAPDVAGLEAFYSEEVAAYLEALVLRRP